MDIMFIGLGRVGLPQALVFAQKGFNVYGFDIDPSVIAWINNLQIPFNEPLMREYLEENINRTFFPLANWNEVHEYLHHIDVIFFTIGTAAPTAEEAINATELNLTGHFNILDELFSRKKLLKPGIKLIFRTTFPLGATDKLKEYIEKKYSLREGEHFHMAFVPERVVMGSVIEEEQTLPKIIGTYSEATFNALSEIFKKIGGEIIRVRNPITAEFCKLTDNAFRNTIFGYANEIAMYASHFDIDSKEVIDTVNMNYKRNRIPKPGFVSGYCLDKDPYIFELNFLKKEDNRDFHSVWYYARRTNDILIPYTVSRILKHLTNPNESCVAILGLSFKEGVDDFRMSHAFGIMQALVDAGVKKFKVYDPNICKNKYTKFPEEFLPYILEGDDTFNQNLLIDVDAVIICDRCPALRKLNDEMKLENYLARTKSPCYLFDGWNIWREAIKLSHIIYEGLGFSNRIRD